MIVYKTDGTEVRAWTCTDSYCTCEGAACSDYTLTVSTEGTAPDLSPFFDCSFYGNTVKYERNDGGHTGVYEIAIIRKPGRITDFILLLTSQASIIEVVVPLVHYSCSTIDRLGSSTFLKFLDYKAELIFQD